MKMMLINYPRLSLADAEDLYNDTFIVVHNNITRRRIRYDQWQKKIHHWSQSSSDSCHLGMDFALNIGK
jgi:hypothetical protein